MIDISNLGTAEYLISEIFYSIQGEGSHSGLPCVFVRMQGCMLRCSWCDTPYALDERSGGVKMTAGEILHKIESFDCNFIEFTGGEPLRQQDIVPLMSYLCDLGYTVAIETNGHVDIGNLDSRIIKIMDIKCPGSHMSKFDNFENIKYLDKKDEVKFVILDRADYDWAKDIIKKYSLNSVVSTILFSPVFGKIEPIRLAEWILADHLPVRLQLQIHKFIWAPETRGV